MLYQSISRYILLNKAQKKFINLKFVHNREFGWFQPKFKKQQVLAAGGRKKTLYNGKHFMLHITNHAHVPTILHTLFECLLSSQPHAENWCHIFMVDQLKIL